jgi:hypothetical protein
LPMLDDTPSHVSPLGRGVRKGCYSPIGRTVVATVVASTSASSPVASRARGTSVWLTAVSVQVGVGVVAGSTATGRRAWRSAVAVIDVATRRRVVVEGRATTTGWRRSVAVVARVVVVPRRRRTTTVVITARAVAARRTATVVVIIHRRTTVTAVATIATAAVAWRAGTETGLALTRDFGLRLMMVN